MKSMLDSLSGMADTMQIFLGAFVEHEHALPEIELNLAKTIKHKDKYVQPAEPQWALLPCGP